jgi:DNA polymerase III delta prime subunit
VLAHLVSLAEGDMRKAIALLQSGQRLAGSKVLTVDTLLEVATLLPRPVVLAALEACKANSFSHLQQCADGIVAQAYPVAQFLDQFAVEVSNDASLSCLQKAHVALKLAQAEHALIDGADEWLQLLDTLGCVAQAIRQQ